MTSDVRSADVGPRPVAEVHEERPRIEPARADGQAQLVERRGNRPTGVLAAVAVSAGAHAELVADADTTDLAPFASGVDGVEARSGSRRPARPALEADARHDAGALWPARRVDRLSCRANGVAAATDPGRGLPVSWEREHDRMKP